ncbi:unnamed protein product, partial [Cladocopium goreaui]
MASSSNAWTEEEQQLLEEGLVDWSRPCGLMKFAMICDIKEKWKAIAGHVGTRDVRACADRFKVCRQRALEQQRALEEQEEEEESDWRQNDWNEWNEWKKDDWWNGWWSGWHDRSWKEETQTPLEEADRRKWEIQEEIEANRRKLEQKEEQKRQHETKREDKLRAEREQKEKERQEQQKAREQKIIEAQEREKQQRLEEEKRQRELQRKMEEEDAKAGFYGMRHLNLSGKPGMKGKGKAWGKGPSKGELQKQRREEEMERRAREVLANIGAKKTEESPESPEVENVEASNDNEPQTATSAPDVPSKAKGAKGTKGKGGDTGDAGDRENADLKGGKSKGGKGSEGRKGKGGKGKGKERRTPGWWTKIDGDCPISLVPIAELPVPPFGLKAEGTGSDAVRREATAVFQHLFRFTHSQNMDSRGRAINFNDGGLTVIDDDDIRVTAAQHAVASTAQALAERDEVPVDTGPVPSPSMVRGPSGAWAKASRPQPVEEFPALPGKGWLQSQGKGSFQGSIQGQGDTCPWPRSTKDLGQAELTR